MAHKQVLDTSVWKKKTKINILMFKDVLPPINIENEFKI